MPRGSHGCEVFVRNLRKIQFKIHLKAPIKIVDLSVPEDINEISPYFDLKTVYYLYRSIEWVIGPNQV